MQHYLERSDPSHNYRVLNAGTPAHSSFQFLNYLRERGLALEPDLVLLYSELNDYLPSSLRDSTNNELGVTMSDRELHSAKSSILYNELEAHSAFFRAVTYSRARSSIARFQADQVSNPLVTISLPKIGLRPRLFEQRDGASQLTRAGSEETALPSRVSPKERRENLEVIAAFCREHEIRLLLIHPSYRMSKAHECLLTAFCSEEKVPMLDAREFLHPPGVALEHLCLLSQLTSRETPACAFRETIESPRAHLRIG